MSNNEIDHLQSIDSGVEAAVIGPDKSFSKSISEKLIQGKEKAAELLSIHPLKDFNTPDTLTESAIVESYKNTSDYLAEKLAQENERTAWYGIYTKSLDDERKARQRYGYGVFGFVGFYILIVLATVWFRCGDPISPQIMMVLLGTTSINVIGLLLAVVKFLFSNHHHKFFDGIDYQEKPKP